MSSPMGTFISGLKTVIEASAVTAPVKIRRDIETQEKKMGAKEFIVLSPMEDKLERPESKVSYLAQPQVKVRCYVVYARDDTSVTKLSDLFHAVRNAIYGQDFGGRRSIDIELTAEYQADAFETNLYYTECILTGEYQVNL